MNRDLDEKEKVRMYLLGTLRDQDEMRQIEEDQLINDEFEENLSIAEEELIEEFLDGELSEAERDRFVSHFLLTPERKHKLSLIRNLRKYAAATAPETIAAPPPQKSSAGWLSYFSRPVFQFAVICLVLIGAGYGVWRVGFYRSNLDDGLASLQRAYRGTRPIDARITGFEYAAIKDTTRGPIDRQPSNALERDLADRLLNQAVIDDKNAKSLYALGKAYLAGNEIDKAISFFEDSAKLNPANAALESDLGAAYLERGAKLMGEGSSRGPENLDKSIKHLQRAIDLDPNLLEPRFNLALALEAYKLPDPAKDAWNEYIRLDPGSRWTEEARNRLKDLN